MRNCTQIFRKAGMRSTVRCLVAMSMVSAAIPVLAAMTDISDAPFLSTASSQLKPNIMLLMDTSNSMRFSHMPDEIEGANSGAMPIGYKSFQCNVLYYNPNQTYVIPKDGSGTALPTPSFTAAPYNYYSTDTTTVNLSTSFRAYDTATRQYQTVSDAAQPAYYYLHSVTGSKSYLSPPCTDVDVGATVAANGGGTWTRVVVSATSGPGATDERQNFAIWYTYYRTRISLIKSAVSRAFTPLTDSFRVGLVTVRPDLTGTANYLPIADFDTTQRTNWFNKLFSQEPGGSSPSREALARVGRHYAGKQDGINDGMTGDPIQYSCQQNFTIMTTDGYWNVAAETAGPVRIDGTTLVGQQDGSLDYVVDSTHWTQRPMWDGGADTTRVVTDKTTQYRNVPCTSLYANLTTTQARASTNQNLQSTQQTLQSTTQNLRSTVQNLKSTVQNLESTTQTLQSTTQNRQSTVQNLQSTLQNLRSTTQITQTTTQTTKSTYRNLASTTQNLRTRTRNLQSTTQNLKSTVQNLKSTVQNLKNTSQNLQSTTQNLQSTAQNLKSTYRNLKSTNQTTQTLVRAYQSTSQILKYDATTELTTPVASCTPGGNITCTTVTTGPTAVASCTPVAAAAGNLYTATTCTSSTTGPTGVASCTPAAATSANGYTTTTCGSVVTTNVPVATCTAAAASSSNSYTTTTCSTDNVTTNVPSQTCSAGTAGSGATIPYLVTTCSTNNTTNVPVQTCSASSATSGNNWTTTTCSTNNTSNVPVQTCSASSPSSGNNWTTTTCSTNNQTNVPTATCTAASASSSNSWTTTTCPAAVTTTNVPSATCTAAAASSGNSYTTTTCSTANVTTNVPVQTCTGGTALGTDPIPYLVTTCSTNNTSNVAVQTCSASAATSGNNWTTTTCSLYNFGTQPEPVSSCTAATATSSNTWTTTACSTNNTSNVPVATCTAQTAASGNSWVTRTCSTDNVTTNVPVQTCTAGTAGAGDPIPYLVTTCNTSNNTVGVASCTPQTAAAGNNWTTITCGTNNNPNVPVQTCTPSTAAAGNNWTTTTCSTNNTTNVPVASCTAQTAASGNNWVTRTCSTANVTTNVPVQTCTAGTALGTAPIPYLVTTCSTNNTSNVPVQTCTASAADAGNSWTTTTCSSNNNLNNPVSSCTPQTAASGNSWVTRTCPAPIVTTNVPSATCTPATASSGNSYTTTTCSTANVTTNVPVQTCSAGTALGTAPIPYLVTTCSTNNTSNVPVQTCTASAADAGNSWTTTTCTPNNTTNQPVQTCSAAVASSGNNWTTTTCPAPIVTTNVPVASCSPQTAAAGNSWVTRTCSSNNTGPTEVASCTPIAASAGNAWTATNCAYLPGKKLQRGVKTDVTTLILSGGPSGFEMSRSTVTTPSTYADVDGICYPDASTLGAPALGYPPADARSTSAEAALPTGCSAWPCIVDTAITGGSSSSLADVAQYYYVTDLRPSMENNVKVKDTGVEDDRATHQHMTTFTLALGVSGSLTYDPLYKTAAVGDFARIRCNPLSGGCNNTCPTTDPSYPNCTPKSWPVWPDPDNYNYAGDPALYSNPRSIDDFWHAAVNGRGMYFSASEPDKVVDGLQKALAGIQATVGSGAAAATSSLEPVAGDNFVYRGSYTTLEWVGDLVAYQIDPYTGQPSNSTEWSAQSLLNSKVGKTSDNSAGCDNRNIYLFRSGATNNLVNFTWNTKACDAANQPTGTANTGLNAAEQAYFNATRVAQLSQYPSMSDGTGLTVDQRTAAAGANLVNFIRGQKNLEGPENFKTNDLLTLYRSRTKIMGDLVNAQPAFVKEPFANYADSGYSTFKSDNASRTGMVYVGANDGMLHAFNATTGEETWSYIPALVLPKLFKLADYNYANAHQYYVDGSPSVGDIYVSASSSWKTILVGGLNKGGRGYYALDVTDPASPKGLWEFAWDDACWDGVTPNVGVDCHLGYSFGRPVITKLLDGTWVVIVTSGLNNVNTPAKAGDGVGYLYVLNAATGKLIYKLSTGVGDATTPSGLAQINNFVDNGLVNNTTLRVYGTDMLGNVWRFLNIVNAAPPSLPYNDPSVTLVGTATDPSGNPQPISTRPELGELDGKPWVFAGTGRLLGLGDTTDTQIQSVYGFKDALVGSPVYSDLRASLKAMTMTQVGTGLSAIRTIACAGNCTSTDGWVVDLPDIGERVNVDPTLQLGTLTFASNVPADSVCSPGGYSWINFMDFRTGLAVETAVDHAASRRLDGSLAVGVNILKLQNEKVVAIVNQSNEKRPPPTELPIKTPPPAGKRVSWREVVE